MSTPANTATAKTGANDVAIWDSRTVTRTLRQTLRIYFMESKSEFLIRLRLLGYVIPTILFPIMFYSLFGLTRSQVALAGTTVGAYLLATFGSFGVIAISLFGFGVSVAVERGQGWMQVKRASPMPRFAYFASKIAMSMLFSLVMMMLLFPDLQPDLPAHVICIRPVDTDRGPSQSGAAPCARSALLPSGSTGSRPDSWWLPSCGLDSHRGSDWIYTFLPCAGGDRLSSG
jgi:hypothetical protein